MKKPIQLFLYVAVIVLASACTATYYTPNNQNAGQLSEKDEVMASTGYSLANETRIVHYQAAWSPIESLGLKLGGATFNASNNVRTNPNQLFEDYGLEGQLIEGAIGYYRKVSDHFIVDMYGGMGHFNGSTYDVNLLNVNQSFNRYFIQPSIGLNSTVADLVLSMRFSAVHFNQVNYEVGLDSASYFYSEFYDYAFPFPDDVFYFIEPALTLRVGYKPVKLEFQVGLSFNVSGTALDYDPAFFGVGLVYNFKPSHKDQELPEWLQ